MAYNGYYSNRPQKQDKWSPADDTKGETETFVTRNVKLITFLVCLAVFLTFFGPWSVIRIRQWIEEQETQQEIEQTALSYDELCEIVNKGKYLDWSDFEGHHYEDLWETGMVIRQYTVKGEEYSLMVSAASATAPLDSVLLIRSLDHAEIDLMQGDVEAARAFLGQNN